MQRADAGLSIGKYLKKCINNATCRRRIIIP